VDPNVAAEQFFDATNAARSSAGLPPLGWRADVAAMGVAHSVEMAQAGAIWHGSFVTSGNLKALNASSLGENVGMGQAVGQIHDAFMASEHHRENILDTGFNQVGIGVIVVGGEMFVSEEFLQAKGGPVTARPTPVAHPVVTKAAAPKTTNKVAAAPKKVSASPSTAPAPPSTAAPTSTAPPTTEAAGVVASLESEPVTAAPAEIVPRHASTHEGTALAAVAGILLLLGAAAGHVIVRRRRTAF